ncbi:helix-turn-helix domain-containing protein [Streptomyces marincola]|uniref:helix-turn-helix domain-containing protein n=1 Tax=Streptomyces marincola TaxID=2878388 RepID=UPI00159CB9EF|nr:helix-turn-helix domain-containing protein [Streptomyces marincola]
MSSHHAPNETRVVVPLRPAARRARRTPPEDRAAQPSAPGPAGRPEREWPREPLFRHAVGGVLRRRRLAQRRTLKDVADAARISMPYLSELERGRKEASSEVLAAAARALGLGLADLLALVHDEVAGQAAGPRAADDGRATSVTGRPRAGRPAGTHRAAPPDALLLAAA